MRSSASARPAVDASAAPAAAAAALPAPARARLSRLADLALLVAASLVLFVFESLAPSPLPWLRLGLANVVTVAVLFSDGVAAALLVTLARVLLGSLLVGGFLSPAFLLSISGGLAGLLAMAAARRLAPRALSAVGVSVAGSVGHNVGQLLALSLVFVRTADALRLLPYLVLSATLTGCLTGLLAAALIAYLAPRRRLGHGAVT